jgi:hypothetical protein
MPACAVTIAMSIRHIWRALHRQALRQVKPISLLAAKVARTNGCGSEQGLALGGTAGNQSCVISVCNALTWRRDGALVGADQGRQHSARDGHADAGPAGSSQQVGRRHRGQATATAKTKSDIASEPDIKRRAGLLHSKAEPWLHAVAMGWRCCSACRGRRSAKSALLLACRRLGRLNRAHVSCCPDAYIMPNLRGLKAANTGGAFRCDCSALCTALLVFGTTRI